LHGLAAERALEVGDPVVGLPELAGRDDVFVRGDRGRRPRLVVSLPIPNHRGPDVELTAELGQRLLARQNALNLGALELRAEDTPPVGLPRMIAHGASRLMLRPLGVPANWGAPQSPSEGVPPDPPLQLPDPRPGRSVRRVPVGSIAWLQWERPARCGSGRASSGHDGGPNDHPGTGRRSCSNMPIAVARLPSS